MIKICNLTKSYQNIPAVNDITFSIAEGQIVGFLGPNGAGKTTTMSIMSGYLPPDSGTVQICGIDMAKNPIAAKSNIGYLPERPPLYQDMTVKEYLSFCCDLKHAQKQSKSKHISEICEMLDIASVYKRVIRTLSKGVQQRVGLAQALIGDPKLLILDEPTVGLDPKQIIDIRKLIKTLGKDRTILLSTHILPEVSAICERVLVISKGKIIADDKPDRLCAFESGYKIYIRVAGSRQSILTALKTCSEFKLIDELGQFEDNSYDFLITPHNNIDIRKSLFLIMTNAKLPILQMHPNNVSLEEVFIELTKSR